MMLYAIVFCRIYVIAFCHIDVALRKDEKMVSIIQKWSTGKTEN